MASFNTFPDAYDYHDEPAEKCTGEGCTRNVCFGGLCWTHIVRADLDRDLLAAQAAAEARGETR